MNVFEEGLKDGRSLEEGLKQAKGLEECLKEALWMPQGWEVLPKYEQGLDR